MSEENKIETCNCSESCKCSDACVCNKKGEVSDLTVIALVTSVLFAPLGWFLGFRARREIERTGKFGRPFATAAIWIGGILTIGVLTLIGLSAAGMAFGNYHYGYGYGHGGRWGNHMMFNEDQGDGEYGYGEGRGMMDWYYDSATTSDG